MYDSIGITNAAVFPEPEYVWVNLHQNNVLDEQDSPVSAIPTTSLYCKPIGIACRWIGEGSL